MKSVNKAEISIIIVNYNTKDYMMRCLRSIYKNRLAAPFEVIVVDNNSMDGSVAALQRAFPDARIIANRKNLGFAHANNQGMRIAAGQWLLLLNSDTEVLPQALNVLNDFMRNHEEAAIAAPMLVDENGERQISCRRFPGIWQEIVKAVGFAKFMPDHNVLGYCGVVDWSRTQEVDQPQGACLMVRRDALSGGRIFDEDFYMYYEEVDLCYRLRKNGWRIYFVPAASVVHFSGKSFSKNMPRMIFHIYRSRFLYYKKHCSLMKQTAIYLLTLGEMIYRTAVYALIGMMNRSEYDEVRLRIKGYCRVFTHFATGDLAE